MSQAMSQGYLLSQSGSRISRLVFFRLLPAGAGRLALARNESRVLRAVLVQRGIVEVLLTLLGFLKPNSLLP